jgi:predicted site-specific integrase-resolvase
MDKLTRISIRQIFLNPRPHIAYMTAADRLGISFLQLKAEIAEGTIVAVSTGVGMRVSKEEMIAAAMRTWPQAMIEEALGDDAARVMPEAIRLVELRARVPRYQKEMLQWLARRNQTSVDDVLTRELEDLVRAYADEITSDVSGFELAMSWPEPDA